MNSATSQSLAARLPTQYPNEMPALAVRCGSVRVVPDAGPLLVLQA